MYIVQLVISVCHANARHLKSRPTEAPRSHSYYCHAERSEASEIPPGHIVAVLRPPRSRHTLPQCPRSASVQARAGAVREPPLLRFRSE